MNQTLVKVRGDRISSKLPPSFLLMQAYFWNVGGKHKQKTKTGSRLKKDRVMSHTHTHTKGCNASIRMGRVEWDPQCLGTWRSLVSQWGGS